MMKLQGKVAAVIGNTGTPAPGVLADRIRVANLGRKVAQQITGRF